MWLYFWIAQTFWLIWFIIETLTFQFKWRKILLILLMFWSIFWGLHFYFLDQIVSFFILVWWAFRLFIAFIIDKDSKLFLFFKYFFIISIFVFTYYFYKSCVDIISLLAWITWIISSFQQNEKYLRIIAMISTFLWLIVSILSYTPISIIASIFFLLSNIIWYIRFYKIKLFCLKKKKN